VIILTDHWHSHLNYLPNLPFYIPFHLAVTLTHPFAFQHCSTPACYPKLYAFLLSYNQTHSLSFHSSTNSLHDNSYLFHLRPLFHPWPKLSLLASSWTWSINWMLLITNYFTGTCYLMTANYRHFTSTLRFAISMD